PEVLDGQAVQTIIPNNAAFQTEDLDIYDSDCDDISNVKAILMANISNYGSDVTDMSKVDKIEANQTKPGTRMKRVQEIKAKANSSPI
nr:hypothetical protein [Tanacetum cinerariifolium]